jgi:lipoprotein-anchoring transpeptidase ErfK/SrfK
MRSFARFTAAAAVLATCLIAGPSLDAKPRSKALTPEAVEKAEYRPGALRRSRSSPLALKAQVLLDRVHMSPGVIDGVFGAGAIEAVKTFQVANGGDPTGKLRKEEWDKLAQAAGPDPVLTQYEIKNDDVKGPFLESIPDDYAEQAKLKRLGYTSALEGLAEKFHMDEKLLQALNPGKSFDKAGETITVVAVGEEMKERVERIEVDGRQNVLRAYGKDNKIVAAYPATVGSADMPSPSGSAKVRATAENPAYYYNPKKLTFKNVEGEGQIKIAPGPNNPVGVAWIDLDKDTYGIHGAKEPSEVGKKASHGCVRLTNWDVRELAHQVRKGTPVEFVNMVSASR